MNMNKSELKFRLCLLGWILLINLFLQFLHIEYGWIIFISNIMLFTMPGDIRKNIFTVEFGGMVGIIFAFLALLCIGELETMMNSTAAVMIVLTAGFSVLILLNPRFPQFFNNIGFAYFTCAFINTTTFLGSFPAIVGTYIIGTAIFNGVASLLVQRFLEQ